MVDFQSRASNSQQRRHQDNDDDRPQPRRGTRRNRRDEDDTPAPRRVARPVPAPVKQELPVDIPQGMGPSYAAFQLQRNEIINNAVADAERRHPAETGADTTADITPSDKLLRVTSTRGIRDVPENTMNRDHPGTDMRTVDGSDADAVACRGGTIVWSGFYSAQMGYAVGIRNARGWVDVYGHLEKGSYSHLEIGDEVGQGWPIGRIGNSGNAQMGPNGVRLKVLHVARLVPPGIELPEQSRVAGIVPDGPFKGWRRIDLEFDGQLPQREMRLAPAADVVSEGRMASAVQQFRTDRPNSPPVPQRLIDGLPALPPEAALPQGVVGSDDGSQIPTGNRTSGGLSTTSRSRGPIPQ